MPHTPTSPFANSRELHYHGTDVLEVFEHELPADRSGIYGVELELDWRHKTEAWKAIQNAFEQLPCFIAKNDGSICGPEIVTLPMTKEEHHTYIETLQDSGALGHLQATSRDGIHVHIDKTTMDDEAQLCLALLVHLPAMQDLLNVFCRRLANSFCRRGYRYHSTISSQSTAADKANLVRAALRIVNGQDRYDAVNFGAETTIEFRMFKSSTSTAAYMRTIEVVELLRSYAKHDEASLTTHDFIDECTPEKLIAYLLANSSKFPGLTRWVRTSRRFSPWFTRTVATPTQEAERTSEGYLRNRLMGRTQTPTHGEVANAVATMSNEEYVVWYADACNGRFVSARGHVREGSALRWQAQYHRRLIARRTHRRQAPAERPLPAAEFRVASTPHLAYEYA